MTAARARLDVTGQPRVACAAPSFLWRPSDPGRLLVCGEGIEPAVAHLPGGVDAFDLGGSAVLEAERAADCRGTAHLFAAAHEGGRVLAPLHRDKDPLDLLSHRLRAELDPLPEQGELWLSALVGGGVEDELGFPHVRRILLWADAAGVPRAWSSVPRAGTALRASLRGRVGEGFWFWRPPSAGDLERRLLLDQSRRLWLEISSRTLEAHLVDRLAQPLLAWVGGDL